MSDSVFSIAHISDLHFSDGTDRSSPDHAHSIDILRGLETAIPSDLDMLVVSGDISNNGDRQSLINASSYIFKTIPIGGEEWTGLNYPTEKCAIVPGNHDAWNASKSGPFVDRRQKSLRNYNAAFPSHQIPECGCYYRWITKGDLSIYIACIDSCFLGDTEKNEDSSFGTARCDQAVAKGKLSTRQSQMLLEWHDKGRRGELVNPSNSKSINKEEFADSLKILVMHHYFFEPPNHKSDYFMRVSDRDTVFRNIAFSDFDIHLCGHKHIPACDVHTYGFHFDDKAKYRYLLNCFRRMIGMPSLPLQFKDEDGKFWSKAQSLLLSLLYRFQKQKNPDASTVEIIEEVLEQLRDGLLNPSMLENKVEKALGSLKAKSYEVFSREELKEIQTRISKSLTPEERKRLSSATKKINRAIRELDSRTYYQMMSGSSAKVRSAKDKMRTFNIIEISKPKGVWVVVNSRYSWDWGRGMFMSKPVVQSVRFE